MHLPEGPPSAGTYDVFGTANFFNFKPWTASIEYLLEQGIERIAEYDQQLVSHLVDGLDAKKYTLVSPREGAACLTCADFDHLVFRPSDDTALKRRFRKHSRLSTVRVCSRETKHA